MNADLSAFNNISSPVRTALLLTAGALVVSAALVVLAILPARTTLYTLRTEIASLENTIANMKTDIAGTEKQRAKTAAASQALNELLATGELQPLLGSFAMRGKSLLDQASRETGFTVTTVNPQDLPLIKLQVPTPAPLQLYGRQPVEFTGTGSYSQIMDFVAKTEASCPLAILSSLSVLSQPQTPEQHKAIITFEWPAKGEKRQEAAAKAAKPSSKPPAQ